MLRLFLSARDLNALLGEEWRFEDGYISGRVKLPIGSVSLVAIPSMAADGLLFLLPFDAIKGQVTGALFGQVVKMLWGPLQEHILKRVQPMLGSAGLPADTVRIDKFAGPSGTTGRIWVSLDRLAERARWRALRLRLSGLEAHDHGVELAISLLHP